MAERRTRWSGKVRFTAYRVRLRSLMAAGGEIRSGNVRFTTERQKRRKTGPDSFWRPVVRFC